MKSKKIKTSTCIRIRYLILFTLLFMGMGIHNVIAQKTMQTTGDVLLFALPTTVLGATLIIGDKKGTWQFTKGFLINQVLTVGLKEAINKPRPFNSGDKAFPSGHTSTTFQSASFIQRRYGWKYGIPAYVLAGFTGYSRINAKKHDGWDVMAGAIIGIGSTYLFTTPYQKEHMELTFFSWEDNYALGFKYKF
ncbi:MAG: phosphatase PAP2 family protein [Oleispira sp.]|nr:phosphatase PAP2 family protein [Oleispira sp.]